MINQSIPGVLFAEKPGTGVHVAKGLGKSQRVENGAGKRDHGLFAKTGRPFNVSDDAGPMLTGQLADNLVEMASSSSDLKSNSSTPVESVLIVAIGCRWPIRPDYCSSRLLFQMATRWPLTRISCRFIRLVHLIGDIDQHGRPSIDCRLGEFNFTLGFPRRFHAISPTFRYRRLV